MTIYLNHPLKIMIKFMIKNQPKILKQKIKLKKNQVVLAYLVS